MRMHISNALDHVQYSVMFDNQEWASRENSAWIYGIIVGWPDDFLPILARRFNWDPGRVETMRQLHSDFLARRDVELKMEEHNATN